MEKILLTNVLSRLQIQSKLKDIQDLEKELAEIQDENKMLYRETQAETFKVMEETKDIKDYFESLKLYIRSIQGSIHSKRSKVYRLAHHFTKFTVIEFALVFFIGLVFSLIICNIKLQPR